jgi:hypothetical protein
MLDALKRNGSPPPVFHSDEAPADALAHVVAHDVFDLELKALYFCQHVPHSNAEILAHVGAYDRSGTITRALSNLTNQGLLALGIPEKPKSKNQKRITTTQGKALVENLTTTRRSGHGRVERR